MTNSTTDLTEAEMIERRAHPRVASDLAATGRRLGGREADIEELSVLDISQGGARLAGSADMRTGDVVLVTINAPDGDLRLKALVVSATALVTEADPIRLHVAWTSVSVDARERLGFLLGVLAEV